jgi:hypothetical protein
MFRFWIDAGVLGGLTLALLLVVVVDKLLPTTHESAAPAPIQMPTPQTIVTTLPGKAKELRLAVTPSHQDKKTGPWDDMAKLLTTLGEGYQFRLVDPRELYQAKKFADFDVLFLTCAPGGTEPALTGNLRDFVAKGGTLYASDWRYDCVAEAFPDVAAPHLRGDGTGQDLNARVVDPGLRDLLGDTVPLRFDLNRWKPAAFAGDRVKVLLEGNYRRDFGGSARAPLLVKFQFGEGTVIFTSFHNEKQNSAIEQKLLKYLVFSAVTAQIENQVNQTLIKGGFSPQKQNLLSASADNPKVTYAYRATKAGKIRFVLGFDDRGAKLHLSVVNPAGKKSEHEGTSSFVIEDVSSGSGDWQYTITALTLPFPEFPFTVTVAESD